jgi:hypothetical protein
MREPHRTGQREQGLSTSNWRSQECGGERGRNRPGSVWVTSRMTQEVAVGGPDSSERFAEESESRGIFFWSFAVRFRPSVSLSGR